MPDLLGAPPPAASVAVTLRHVTYDVRRTIAAAAAAAPLPPPAASRRLAGHGHGSVADTTYDTAPPGAFIFGNAHSDHEKASLQKHRLPRLFRPRTLPRALQNFVRQRTGSRPRQRDSEEVLNEVRQIRQLDLTHLPGALPRSLRVDGWPRPSLHASRASRVEWGERSLLRVSQHGPSASACVVNLVNSASSFQFPC